MLTAIHRKDAMRLLRDKKPHRLRLWKISTGDILTYHQATYIGAYQRKGMTRLRLYPSNEIRAFRDFALFEIDNLKIYW